jgi:phosphoenolpyruvate phosphomutase
MKLPDLLQLLIADGAKVRVIYTTGHWLDVDSVEDVVVGAAF